MAIPNSLQGTKSVRTLVLYKLDPTGTKPIEPLIDLVPGTTGNRITLDVIESEGFGQTYDVTTNAVQDFSFANTNIRRVPRTISVTGVMSSFLQIQSTVVGASILISPPSTVTTRSDFERFQNLQQLADARQPIAIYTPRHSFPTCALTSLSADWSPETGRNTRVSLSFIEINIVSPLTGNYIADYDASVVKNNSITGGGQQTPQTSQLNPGPPNSFGNGPSFSTPFA